MVSVFDVYVYSSVNINTHKLRLPTSCELRSISLCTFALVAVQSLLVSNTYRSLSVFFLSLVSIICVGFTHSAGTEKTFSAYTWSEKYYIQSTYQCIISVCLRECVGVRTPTRIYKYIPECMSMNHTCPCNMAYKVPTRRAVSCSLRATSDISTSH